LLNEARRRHLPQLVVIQIGNKESREFFASHHPVIANLPASPAEPTAYLCENFACRLPVTDPKQLGNMLSELASLKI
jgi:uncharacterized protein YyaL (SSP411 family)